MITKVKSKLKNSTPTRYNRILNYKENLENKVKITSKSDSENIKQIDEIITKIIKKIKIYSRFNIGLYFAIYFSFISFFFSDILILSELASLISRIISAFGTAVFIIGIYFSNKIIELYYQDLNLITAHLISIYTKYQKDKFEEFPTSGNYYQAFIEFFDKRY